MCLCVSLGKAGVQSYRYIIDECKSQKEKKWRQGKKNVRSKTMKRACSSSETNRKLLNVARAAGRLCQEPALVHISLTAPCHDERGGEQGEEEDGVEKNSSSQVYKLPKLHHGRADSAMTCVDNRGQDTPKAEHVRSVGDFVSMAQNSFASAEFMLAMESSQNNGYK